MPTIRSAAIRDELATLFGSGAVGSLSDAELLGRFVERRGEPASEAAFAALVDRHGPLVFGVCRRALGDSHEAEDAFQATFLELSRRAGSVRVGDSLGPWLYRVGVRTARRARARARADRLRTGGMAGVEPADPVVPPDPAAIGELRAALDEEIARLPAHERAVALLCLVEGRSQEEAARRLRRPVGTIQSRLHRAKARLRGRLGRRGLAPEPLVLVTVGGQAVPSAVRRAAIRTALLDSGGGAIPAGVAALVGSGGARGAARVLVAAAVLGTGAIGAAVFPAGPSGPGVRSAEVRAVAGRADTPRDERPRPPRPVADDPPDVAAILREAVEAARADESPRSDLALEALAPALARSGDVDAAIEAAGLIAHEPFRENALERVESARRDPDAASIVSSWLEIASARRRRGDREAARRALERAAELAEGIDGEWPRASALERIAEGRAMLGDRDLAAALLEEAAGLLGAVPEGPLRIEAVSRIAIARAGTGDRRGAEAMIGEVLDAVDDDPENGPRRAALLAGAARARAALGDRDEAEELIRSVERIIEAGLGRPFVEEVAEARERGWSFQSRELAGYAAALKGLGAARIVLGDLAAARAAYRAALEATIPQNRRLVLASQARDGDVEGALIAAAELPDEGPRMQGLELIAAIRAESGDAPGAIRTAESISGARIRGAALARIAEIRGEAGDAEGASATLDRAFRAAREGPEALIAIASAQARLGDAREALGWARDVSPSALKATVLLAIAEGLMHRASREALEASGSGR